MPARLTWKEGADIGHLHFIDPHGDHAVVPVRRGEPTVCSGRHVWHIEVAGDTATVSPSVHLVGRWHSPNPARFRLVDELNQPT